MTFLVGFVAGALAMGAVIGLQIMRDPDGAVAVIEKFRRQW